MRALLRGFLILAAACFSSPAAAQGPAKPGGAESLVKAPPWQDAVVLGHRYEVEAGADGIMIYSKLRTTLRSATDPRLNWDDTIFPSGTGFHGSMFWLADPDDGEDDEPKVLYGFSGGYFASSYQSNKAESGDIFARETLDTRCGWASADVKYYPMPWSFIRGAVGTFIYSVDSRLETNAVGVDYDGLRGVRALGIFGFGAGFVTPWRFPLQASLEGKCWMTHKDDPQDARIVQVSASLHLRF